MGMGDPDRRYFVPMEGPVADSFVCIRYQWDWPVQDSPTSGGAAQPPIPSFRILQIFPDDFLVCPVGVDLCKGGLQLPYDGPGNGLVGDQIILSL